MFAKVTNLAGIILEDHSLAILVEKDRKITYLITKFNLKRSLIENLVQFFFIHTKKEYAIELKRDPEYFLSRNST